MEIMVFIFCLLFLCHNGDSSFQFFRDVWSGKKLCVGEGGYCQINLKFPACCEPYICTKIPRANKPTVIVKLTDFMFQRCLLPSTVTEPTNLTHHNIEEYITETFNTSDNLNGTVDQYSDGSNSTETVANNNFNNEILQYTTEHGIEETKFTPSKENLSKNLHSKNIIKRSIPAIYPSSNNNTEGSEVENTAEYSGQNNLTSSEYSESIYSDTSNSSYYSSEYEEINNTTAKYVDLSDVETNQTKQNYTTVEDKTLSNNVLDKNSTTSNNISVEEIDDDWTSSQMDFDRRPTLHKVVTIPPFHFFQSVEVNQINETIETSDF